MSGDAGRIGCQCVQLMGWNQKSASPSFPSPPTRPDIGRVLGKFPGGLFCGPEALDFVFQLSSATRTRQKEWRWRLPRISLFDNAKPSNAVARMYEGLSRPQCSVLTQLRTTHLALNGYLYRFHLAPSPTASYASSLKPLGTARLSLRRLLAVKSDSKPVLRFVRDTGRFPRYAL
ncbi:hypothetical protein B0H13DRAFT_2381619 [Mycena leptocephala]|nr:hypothetical protein B0H13DRAFT_2381619 [Mycena leptocephala]